MAESVGKASVSLEGVHRDKSVLFIIIIFLAVLRCCPDFSLVAEWRLHSRCGARASHCGGFSCSEVQALGSWASVPVVLELICTVACGSSRARDQTCVLCIVRQILIPWTTREALFVDFWMMAILTCMR